MTTKKYEHLIVSEMKGPAQVMAGLEQYKNIGHRILWVDSGVVPGSFQMNISFYLHPTERGPEPHAHDVDEILGFFSADPNNPYDLGGEIEFWMDDEKLIIDRSAIVFIPAGVVHCPLILRKITKPVIHFSEVTSSEYTPVPEGWVAKPSTGYANNLVTELKVPADVTARSEEYSKYARRVLWLDENVVPGAFHINISWLHTATPGAETPAHVHDEGEMLGFIGSDPENPTDLNGEVEIWLGDEQYILTRSTMIFVPAGLKHCPLITRRVDRPIFHFSTVPGKRYIKEDLK